MISKNLFSKATLISCLRYYPHIVIGTLFLIARFLLGKNIEETSRIFLPFILLTVFLPSKKEGANLAHQFYLKSKELLDYFIYEKPIAFSFVFFLGCFLSHTLWTLGIRPGYAFDTTFVVQAAYNSFHPQGYLFKTLDGFQSFFTHHFSPYLFLFWPLAQLREAPFWFFLVQDLSLSLYVYLLIKMFKELPKDWRALLLLACLQYPFFLGVIQFEFHELSFAPLGFMLAYMGHERKKPWLLYSSVIFLLCVKEQLAWSVILFGFLIKDFIIVSLGVSATVLFFGFFPRSRFLGYYSDLGSGPMEIILSPFLRPMVFLKTLFTLANFIYMLQFLGLVAPFLKKGFMYLIPTITDTQLAILTPAPNIKYYGNQYGGGFLFWIHLTLKKGFFVPQTLRGKNLLTAFLLFNIFFWVKTNPIKNARQFLTTPYAGIQSRPTINYVRDLPKDVPVLVSKPAGDIIPFVAQRDNLYHTGDDVPPKPYYLITYSFEDCPKLLYFDGQYRVCYVEK